MFRLENDTQRIGVVDYERSKFRILEKQIKMVASPRNQ